MISRFFESLIQFAFDLAAALIKGLMGAPVKAILPEVVIRHVLAAEVIDVRHAVLRAGRPREHAFFEGDNDEHTTHWGAMLNGHLVGVASVLKATSPDSNITSTRQLRGMAVLSAHRGIGIGSALLKAIMAEEGALWCNARESAMSFYADHGWKPVGQPFEVPQIGPHQRLVYLGET